MLEMLENSQFSGVEPFPKNSEAMDPLGQATLGLIRAYVDNDLIPLDARQAFVHETLSFLAERHPSPERSTGISLRTYLETVLSQIATNSDVSINDLYEDLSVGWTERKIKKLDSKMSKALENDPRFPNHYLAFIYDESNAIPLLLNLPSEGSFSLGVIKEAMSKHSDRLSNVSVSQSQMIKSLFELFKKGCIIPEVRSDAPVSQYRVAGLKEISNYTPIRKLSPSTRSYNALRHNGIYCVEPLIHIPPHVLSGKNFRHLGTKLATEIITCIDNSDFQRPEEYCDFYSEYRSYLV